MSGVAAGEGGRIYRGTTALLIQQYGAIQPRAKSSTEGREILVKTFLVQLLFLTGYKTKERGKEYYVTDK